MSKSAKRAKSRVNSKTRKRYRVDIVTSVYGSPDHLEALAQSLLYDVDAGIEFKWILVDDNTPEDRDKEKVINILDKLSEHEDVVVVKSNVNEGYAITNNKGVAKGRAPLVLLLNSDIILVDDGWLVKLVANFTNPAIGIVGARLLFFEDSDDSNRPAGKVQHAGVVFNMLKQPYHIFLGWDAEHSKVMQKRTVPAVTGACLMVRRKLWRAIGGLEPVYTTGNFEDVELCVQVGARGFNCVYDPEVFMYHYAGGSGNSITAKRNLAIFHLRMGKYITWSDWAYY